MSKLSKSQDESQDEFRHFMNFILYYQVITLKIIFMKDTFLKRDLTAVIVLFLVFVLILVGLFMWDRNSGVLEVLAGKIFK